VILAISAAVDGCAVAKAGPSIDQSLRGGHHRRRKIHNRPAREHWGDNPSLQTPLLALGAQEAVVQSRRQYPALEAILPIVWGVVAQNAADGARFVHQQHMPERQSACNDGPFEVRRCPAFQRVSIQGKDKGYRS
jgi:hypothetical protein